MRLSCAEANPSLTETNVRNNPAVPAEVKFAYKIGQLVHRLHYYNVVCVILGHEVVNNYFKSSLPPQIPAYYVHWLTEDGRADYPRVILEKYLVPRK